MYVVIFVFKKTFYMIHMLPIVVVEATKDGRLRRIFAMLSHSVVFSSLGLRGLEPTSLLCLWDSPAKTITVGCHALLQGIFPVQGWNQGLPDCR